MMKVNVCVCLLLLCFSACADKRVYYECGARLEVLQVEGLVLSPGFPFNYSSGLHCVWQFFIPAGHTLSLELLDFDVFESERTSVQEEVQEEVKEEDYDQVRSVATLSKATSPKLDVQEEQKEVHKQEEVQEKEVHKEEEVQEKEDYDQVTGVATLSKATSRKLDVQEVQKEIQEEVQKEEVQEEVKEEESDQVKGVATLSKATSHKLDIQEEQKEVHKEEEAQEEDYDQVPKLSRATSRKLDVQEEASKMSNVAPPAPQTPPPPGDKSRNSISPPKNRIKVNEKIKEEEQEEEKEEEEEDACPHDVLYISDLLSFSSRFCGSSRPPGQHLLFGSEAEMVEVIMELITTTHRGRGFALLYRYSNRSRGAEPAGRRRGEAQGASGGDVDVLLAVVSGAALFVMSLASVLCLILRSKLCAKGSNSTSSISSEVTEGAPHSGVDGSELQLVTPNHTEPMSLPVNTHTHLSHTGCDVSQNAELQCDGLSELEMGTDEVFVISAEHNNTTSTQKQRERYLRHSDTGPVQASDWPTSDSSILPTPTSSGQAGLAVSARPRAWSVRTFHDFLPPLPELHRKWCSWNSTSPFTKLVDSGSPGSVTDRQENLRCKVLSDGTLPCGASSCRSDWLMSSCSYPLAQSAQRQRRLSSTSNMRRSRFPGFSLETPRLAGGANANANHTPRPAGGANANANQTPRPAGGANANHTPRPAAGANANPTLRPAGGANANHTPSSPDQQQPEPNSNSSSPCGQQKPLQADTDSSLLFVVSTEEDHLSVFCEDDLQPLVTMETRTGGQSYQSPLMTLSPAHSVTITTREEPKSSALKNGPIQVPSLTPATAPATVSMVKDM